MSTIIEPVITVDQMDGKRKFVLSKGTGMAKCLLHMLFDPVESCVSVIKIENKQFVYRYLSTCRYRFRSIKARKIDGNQKLPIVICYQFMFRSSY